MDFGKLLTRAWQITWRWKVLWILGFLASLGSGTGTGNINYSFDGDEFAQMPGYRGEFPPEIIGILMAVACLA
ncbi:MAG: hypothetical protein PVG11_05750, partial [Anaerolineae bacterium]